MDPQVEEPRLLRRLQHLRTFTGKVLHAPPELEERMLLQQVCVTLRDNAVCVPNLKRGQMSRITLDTVGTVGTHLCVMHCSRALPSVFQFFRKRTLESRHRGVKKTARVTTFTVLRRYMRERGHPSVSCFLADSLW